MSSTTQIMDLPKEIREKMLAELVSIKNNVTWQRILRDNEGTTGWDLDASLTWEIPQHIFATNKQLSTEALEVFYRENNLVFVKCHSPAFLMDTVSKVILLKFVVCRPKNVALHIELCFGHWTSGSWYPSSETTDYDKEGFPSSMPENHKFYDCALFAADELPKLVQLLNCSFSSPLFSILGRRLGSAAFTTAELYRIYFDFNISSSYYEGNLKLVERMIHMLKGLRKFEAHQLGRKTAPRKLFFKGKGLSSKAIEEFRESSNLEQWTEEQAFAEVSRIKAVGDQYASTGDNFRCPYSVYSCWIDARL